MASLLSLLLFLVLFASFFGVAARKQTAPVGLDPLGASGEQLHSLALFCLLPFYDFLNFLLLPVFLQALLPFRFKLVKFIVLIIQLFVQSLQFRTLLVKFSVVGLKRSCVAHISAIKCLVLVVLLCFILSHLLL